MSDGVEQVGPARIHVTFDNPDEIGMGGESMFADRIGDGDSPGTGLYRIDNIPFFVEAFGYGAVVECDETRLVDLPDSPYHGTPAIPEFVRVVTPAPGSTAQVVFVEGLPNAVQLAIIDQLKAAGGKVERAASTFWVVFIPTESHDEIVAILDSRLEMAHLDFHVQGDDEQ